MEYSESELAVRERHAKWKEEEMRERARLSGIENDATITKENGLDPAQTGEAEEDIEEVDAEEEERIKSEADALELELLGECRLDLTSDKGQRFVYYTSTSTFIHLPSYTQ